MIAMKDFILSNIQIKKIFYVLFFYLSSSHLIFGQYAQMGSKLVGTGGVGQYINQGASICLSSDGKTMAVGGPNDKNGMGSVWVYTLAGLNWQQVGEKLVGTGAIGNALQGTSVSLSANGRILAVGGIGDNNGTGAVWVYTLSGSNWLQMGAKMVGGNAVSVGTPGNIGQGHSVKISADGRSLAFGGPGDNGGVGAVWIFTFSGSNWGQKGDKLVGTDAVQGSLGSLQGSSLSISADGSLLAVGGSGDNYFLGAVWVYTLSGTNWLQMGNKLVGTGAPNNGFTNQVKSISLSYDGKTLAFGGNVGGHFTTTNLGLVWVYTLSGGNWIQKVYKEIETGTVGQSSNGSIVSLSGDGRTLAVGIDVDSNLVGATWVFTLSGNNLGVVGNKLLGTGATSIQGNSVSLSANGKVLAFGSEQDNIYSGAVWVFTAPGWNSDTASTGGGTTDPVTSDTLSISGTVHQGSGLLTDGIVMAIEKTTNTSKILRVTNGNFTLDSLAKGEYILYAVPNPLTVPNYLPTFYVNKVKLQDAVTLSLRGHIRSVDIYLAALNSTISGTHTITGRFSYEDGNSRDSSLFTSNWFAHTDSLGTVIPITTQACGNMPVLLYNSQNAVLKSALTDSLGYFTFKNIPAGIYKLLGQRNGYITKDEGQVTIGSNSKEIANLKMEAVVTALKDEIDVNNSKVIVYPNPFKDEIIIKGYLGEVMVYDLTGKIVLQINLNENDSISTSTLPAGFYILKAGSTSEKIIKQE